MDSLDRPCLVCSRAATRWCARCQSAPNHVLRLVALAVFLTLALVHLVCLQRPSSQLARLEAMIEKTEKVVDHAKMLCRIGSLQVVLAEENVRLLEAQRSASVIRCCVLETRICSWQKYRLLSREISACVSDVNKVLSASQARAPFFLFGKLIDFPGLQLILEAERQRKYAEDIDAANLKIMLNRAQLMSIRGSVIDFPNIFSSTIIDRLCLHIYIYPSCQFFPPHPTRFGGPMICLLDFATPGRLGSYKIRSSAADGTAMSIFDPCAGLWRPHACRPHLQNARALQLASSQAFVDRPDVCLLRRLAFRNCAAPGVRSVALAAARQCRNVSSTDGHDVR
ncbi:hypothetical protein GGX14DRAFT_696659 [Mycena pura]|uniref:Uncharacterized protein n=1 Tax=Mycena pura TaxID=153505 RepID=A0AAD6VI90_9AGAR|nr:hypothetical protein GGX14DRAFT_696659 [Mycena pura]